MLKRKLLMTILPVLSAAVIAGAGFSAWHFGGTVDNDEIANVGTIVEGATDGSVTVTSTTKPETVTFDQGGSGNTDNNVGIKFDTNWKISVTFPSATNYNNYTIELKVEISSPLSSYVTLVGTNNESISDIFEQAGTVNDATLTFTSREISVTGGAAVSYTFNLNNESHNNLFNYTNKPADYNAWSTLYGDLNGKSNLVTLTATVNAK